MTNLKRSSQFQDLGKMIERLLTPPTSARTLEVLEGMSAADRQRDLAYLTHMEDRCGVSDADQDGE